MAKGNRGEYDLSKVQGMGNGNTTKGCGNEACYCDGSCKYKQFTGNNDIKISTHTKEESDISIKVTADVDDAVSGFKRLQRELRKTTQEARELESAYKDLNKIKRAYGSYLSINDIPMRDLAEELARRIDEGINLEMDGRKIAESIERYNRVKNRFK